MYIRREFRRANHIGGVRKKLARMIVSALAKEGVKAVCDPSALWPAQGYWRQVEQDVYSWEGYCEIYVPESRKWLKKSLGSWDRMSSCVKGITIGQEGFGFEVYAVKELSPEKRFKISREMYERKADASGQSS